MTFEEVYKILYEKHEIVSFDYSDKTIKAKDSVTIITFDLFYLIEGLKETYAPEIKMTSEQKEQFMAFVNSPDNNFENFWFCLGSGDSLYKNKISEDDLMRAWLHPELIEVSYE